MAGFLENIRKHGNPFKDPPGGTQLRFELATRISMCVALSLVFGIGWWYKNAIKCMVSILTVVFAFMTPPYLGSSIMILSAVIVKFFLTLGVTTGAILLGATYFEGEPDGQVQHTVSLVVYLIIAAYWLLIIPPMRVSNLQIGIVMVLVTVAVPVYSFLAVQDMVVTGVVFGYQVNPGIEDASLVSGVTAVVATHCTQVQIAKAAGEAAAIQEAARFPCQDFAATYQTTFDSVKAACESSNPQCAICPDDDQNCAARQAVQAQAPGADAPIQALATGAWANIYCVADPDNKEANMQICEALTTMGGICAEVAKKVAPTYDTDNGEHHEQHPYDGIQTTVQLAICQESFLMEDTKQPWKSGDSALPPLSPGFLHYAIEMLKKFEDNKQSNDEQQWVGGCFDYEDLGVQTTTRSLFSSLAGIESAEEAAGIWNDEKFCFGFGADQGMEGQTLLWGMVKPGAWLGDFLWKYQEWRMNPMLSFVYAAIIAGACTFLMSFLPPARFATDRLRTLIRDQMLRLRNERLPAALPAGVGAHEDLLEGVEVISSVPQEPLPADCPIGPTSGRQRLFNVDEPIFQTMNTIGALTVVEINFLDPGPFVALWPSYRKIIPMMKTFSDQMVMTAFLADLSADVHPADTLQEGLLQAVDRLIFEMAFCMSLRPSAGGSAAMNTELMCIKLEEKCDAVKDAAAQWTVVTDAGDSAEKRILVEGHRLAALQMAGSACAIAEGIMSMLKVHSTPSIWGFLMTILGLFLPIIAVCTDIFKFWFRVFTPWTSKWKGDWAWWKDTRTFFILHFAIALTIATYLFGFVTDFRRWNVVMVNPVYFLPGGRMGQWMAVPLVVVLLHSWHGTFFRAPIRLVSLIIGALMGLPALEMLRWGRSNGLEGFVEEGQEPDEGKLFWGNFACIAYLTVLIFVCVITSADTTGRLAMYGTFHNQFGYGPFMIAYFACVMATEGIDLTQNSLQGGESLQPSAYSVWDYFTIRITDQAIGCALCMVIACLLPIPAGWAARKISSQCLRLLARALLTGIQTWRGDDVSEEAEQEALQDMEWTHYGRQRTNHFILEMDGLGRGRQVFGDWFFTALSGNKEDLPALRTLQMDLAMFITQLMKGCRAPIGPIPPFLDRLATAVDIWAVACAKRVVYVANGQYVKLQGLHSPSDEALDVFEAFRQALPGLIELAELEIQQEEEERQYDIEEEYAAAKAKSDAAKSKNSSAAYPAYPYGSQVSSQEPAYYGEAAPSSVGSLFETYQLAETSLEADQRWQLLIAYLMALETAIFTCRPQTPHIEEPEDGAHPYAYDYGMAFGEDDNEESDDDQDDDDDDDDDLDGIKQGELRPPSPVHHVQRSPNQRRTAQRKGNTAGDARQTRTMQAARSPAHDAV